MLGVVKTGPPEARWFVDRRSKKFPAVDHDDAKPVGCLGVANPAAQEYESREERSQTIRGKRSD